MGLIFEWDQRKATDNLAKHRVSFEEAATTFGDPMSLTIDDPAHSASEDRFVHIGASYRSRILVTIFTERPERVRIISSRLATQRERGQYEQRLRQA